MAFQDLIKKGIKPCKLADIEVTREKGKKTTMVGDNGMVMKGITVECQVEMTEENTMMVKMASKVTLNKDEMEGDVKVGHKVVFTVEYNIVIKVVQMEGNMVEDIRVAKAKVLGEFTVVETVESKMHQLADVVVKTKTKEGI